MSQSNRLKQQFGCGQNGCGQNGSLCDTCTDSYKGSTTITCPDGNLRCSNKSLCDYCKGIADSLVSPKPHHAFGRKAVDVCPKQQITDMCDECRKTIGSTSGCQTCQVLLDSLSDSPLNPNKPRISYHCVFGPIEGSLGPSSPEITEKLLLTFKHQFKVFTEHGNFPFSGINDSPKCRESLFEDLLPKGIVLGVEGYNCSCYIAAAAWMLSMGSNHILINVYSLSGFILYKVIRDLRFRLFVGRNDIEALRLALQREYTTEYLTKTRNPNGNFDFLKMENEPCDFLTILQDMGILHNSILFSNTGCRFYVHERLNDGKPNESIQKAVCKSLNCKLDRLSSGTCFSFQFFQQFSRASKSQSVGTTHSFPHNGIIVDGKLFLPKMVVLHHSHHYIVMLCVGDSFFLTNSLSAQNEGHFLPETHKLSEDEAMRLFKTQSHTIVFVCVGNAYAPPIQPPCAQSDWVPPPPPPPQVPSAQSDWVSPPPPPAQCESCHLVPSPPPLPAPSAQQAPQQLPKKVVVWFEDDYRTYDPKNKVLRSTLTGRIIDGIKAGFYDVREKETHREIRIELREVLSDDALPPPAPRAQVFSQIQLADITIRNGEWSIRRGSFFQSGTYVVSLNQYTLERVQYDQSQFLTFLNIFYKRSCE